MTFEADRTEEKKKAEMSYRGIEAIPGDGVDVTCHKPDIFIGKFVHAPALRDYVAYELVALFQPAFLVGLVRVTVEHTGAALPVACHFNGPWVLEFRTIILEDHPESPLEDRRVEQIIESVEHILHGLLSTGREQEDEQERRLPEKESHQAFAGFTASLDSVHLNDFIVWEHFCVFEEVLVGSSVPVGIFDRIFASAFLTELVPDTTRQIDVFDSEDAHKGTIR